MSKIETLVLLPGWNNNESTYSGLVNNSHRDLKVLCISYSDLIKNDIKDFVDALANHLKRLEIKKFSLLGHSLGGAFAIEFAYRYPHMVRNLYLVNSEGIYDKQSIASSFISAVRFSSGNWLGFIANVKNFIRNSKRPFLFAGLGKYAHTADLRKEASVIRVPTTIIWGVNDGLTILDQGKQLHKLIKDSKFIEVMGGHNWIIHDPELFWKHINENS